VVIDATLDFWGSADSATIADSCIYDQLDDPDAPSVEFMPFLTGPGTASIAGTITDTLLNPIEGVIVGIAGETVSDTTGIDGRYSFSDLDMGYYDLAFSHDLYNDTSVTGKFAVIHDTLVIDLVLTPWAGCDYVVGDANDSGDYNGLDITFGVSYLKGGTPPPYECDCPLHGIWYSAGDVNGSCDYNGLDITYGISFLKGSATELIPCPDCAPVGE
jgi:hypothetical protein